jgi:hypothetical protein
MRAVPRQTPCGVTSHTRDQVGCEDFSYLVRPAKGCNYAEDSVGYRRCAESLNLSASLI